LLLPFYVFASKNKIQDQSLSQQKKYFQPNFFYFSFAAFMWDWPLIAQTKYTLFASSPSVPPKMYEPFVLRIAVWPEVVHEDYDTLKACE
jgi:hypothetical protein